MYLLIAVFTAFTPGGSTPGAQTLHPGGRLGCGGGTTRTGYRSTTGQRSGSDLTTPVLQ